MSSNNFVALKLPVAMQVVRAPSKSAAARTIEAAKSFALVSWVRGFCFLGRVLINK